ncbi:NADH-quinone oxidoreductase subunit NuoE family protein [Anaerococcus degeneri]|uniref:NAD(P)H-dependent oxidoreductase subunit E n=1 Tax=Anaerococcus degeneri TaxID=361500 RepID=A0ABS7YX15_9FIRM|nr:NAD(P)H-dependent oxidoreductase subunit E [Anaerococcus degeneri]MBP2015302.1 NADH:ubiquinone oxidoreductase subunit E [Anaerococcus degeneri]MCA2096198.1 NAD(P)H-dependent oxidoreductase subunit E [Anaerococcus degeneri]
MSFCFKKDQDKYQEFIEFLDTNKDKKGAIMPILQKAQEIFSYIPEEIVDLMALRMGVHSSEIYGVASFYSQFSFIPKGEHEICVCLGTACYVKGSDKILADLEDELGIKVGETTPDGKISLAEARCIGECGIAPVLSIDSSRNIGNVTKGMAADIIKEVLEEKDEVEA